MKSLLLILLAIGIESKAQYKEFVPGYYSVGDTVQVSSKNSLFKAMKTFKAIAIPSDNQYWNFAGSMSDVKVRELDARLKAAEADISRQKATNLLFSESIASIEDRLDATQVPTTGYLSLPLSPTKVIASQSNIIIENLRFENAAAVMIKITNSSNITIRNCFFNKGVSEAINIYMGTNIRIENCLFNGVTTGVLASTSQGVKVLNNQFVNVKGPMPRGQFVQFNNVTGAGNEVIGNKGENFQGESNPADLISMFGGTSGTATSPLLIKNNMFRGGGPLVSGGGIVAGDYGGSYIVIDGNTLHTPGNYGIAIVGGSYNSIINNKVFSLQTPISNSSIHIWAQPAGAFCANNTIKGNRVYWINKAGVFNDGWNGGGCTNTVWEYPTRITESELNMPSHLIDFITPDELLKLRGK